MIRLSDRYIGRQVLVGTFFTVVVLSLVLILGNLFKEIRPLLIEQRGPVWLVARFVLHIIPFSLVFTIPWGFLASVLLVFGRLSSDNELHGFQMAGLSLPRLAAPVFTLGALLSGLCWWLSVAVAPTARSSMETMLRDMLLKDPRVLLSPGAVQSRFKKMKVFVERKEGGTLHGLHVYQIGSDSPAGPGLEPPTPSAYVHAARAELVIDEEHQNLRATLNDAYIETWREDGTPEIAFSAQAEPWLFDFSATRVRKVRPSVMSNHEIRRFLAAGQWFNENQRLELEIETTRRNAFSLACFALAFIGVPLGINARRKDTASGLVLSLVIGGVYFLFGELATQWHSVGEPMIRALLWTPNVLCIAGGLFLFRGRRFR